MEATEQRDAPVGALELKILHDAPSFINVRAAGDRDCWADTEQRVTRLRRVHRILCSLAALAAVSCAHAPTFICGTWEHPRLPNALCVSEGQTTVIDVRVVDAMGVGIPGASVYVLPMDSPRAEQGVAPKIADDSGVARLSETGSGVHALVVLMAGFFPQTKTVLLEPGCSGSVEVTLEVATGPM